MREITKVEAKQSIEYLRNAEFLLECATEHLKNLRSFREPPIEYAISWTDELRTVRARLFRLVQDAENHLIPKEFDHQ